MILVILATLLNLILFDVYWERRLYTRQQKELLPLDCYYFLFIKIRLNERFLRMNIHTKPKLCYIPNVYMLLYYSNFRIYLYANLYESVVSNPRHFVLTSSWRLRFW